MKSPAESGSQRHRVLLPIALLAIAAVLFFVRFYQHEPETSPLAVTAPVEPVTQPAPDAATAIEPVVIETPPPNEQAAIAQLGTRVEKTTTEEVRREDPPRLVQEKEPVREKVPVREKQAVREKEPPKEKEPPRERTPEPERDALTPQERALQQALNRLRTCTSMVECLDSAKSALTLFGSTEEITTPAKVTIAQFREAQATYRRGQADVLRTAKGITKTAAGRKKEPELRQIFELLPQSDEWVLTAGELEPIRRALDRSVRMWLRDNRLDPHRSIGMMIGILLPTKKTSAEISVVLESGDEAIGDPDRLRTFVVREIQALPELKGLHRQRLARFKLVINPGGSYALD